ncbi:MAG TPA: hypothetical protein PKC12_03200 [Thiobacillaceae bacterium]|nr:hypothetical protein [Thiobacillaceae bacterium]
MALLAMGVPFSGDARAQTASSQRVEATSPEKRLNPRLLGLKAGTWHLLTQPDRAGWRRQSHAGVAYDSKRGTLLLFGSNTHGLDWDNETHEFDPATARWETHYPRAPKESYRADAGGRAIAGTDRLLPWAMHTYDNVVYDPALDAVVVSALPEHNPIRKTLPDAKIHPTWIYDLKTRRWRIFENNGKPYPKFFAAASAYDPDRDVIAAYKWGMWEIGPERDEWRRASGQSHHEIHYTMDYDLKRKQFVVFGDYYNTSAIWTYTPGARAGEAGSWKRTDTRDGACPAGQHFPVAYDAEHGVFLLVADNTVFSAEDERGRRRAAGRARSSSTFVYDPARGSCTRLPRADLAPLGMNYMMVYDRFHKVFLLVTGDHRRPAAVWALKLARPD